MIVHYNTTKIYYTKQGKGSPLVLLHGFLESSTMWLPILPQLQKNNEVICIDFPGFGKSECLSTTLHMHELAEIIKVVLAKEHIKKAHFLGHSMGGYACLALLENNESLFHSITLLNSTTYADSPERKKNRDRAIAIVDVNSEAFISMAITNLFSIKHQETLKLEIEKLKKEAFSFPLSGIKAAIRGLKERKDTTEIFKNYTGTKRMIAGKLDPIVPLSESKQIATHCNSALFLLEGGHMSVNENKDDLLKLLHFID